MIKKGLEIGAITTDNNEKKDPLFELRKQFELS